MRIAQVDSVLILSTIETNVWEADSEFWGNLEDEDNVDELKFLVENQFGFLGISEEEYEFNEEEE